MGDGPLEVNGKALDEPYVYPGGTPCSSDPEGQFKVTVPSGRVWVMGDNRQGSEDSRYHQDEPGAGMVPVDDVVGRAVVAAWPVTRWDVMSFPGTFEQSGIGTVAGAGLPGALALAGAVPFVLLHRRGTTDT